AVAVGTTVAVESSTTQHVPPANSPSGIVPRPRPSTSVPQPPASSAPSNPVLPATPSSAAPQQGPSFDLGYQPLYPFGSLAEAQAWQTASGGHQPWHASA